MRRRVFPGATPWIVGMVLTTLAVLGWVRPALAAGERVRRKPPAPRTVEQPATETLPLRTDARALRQADERLLRYKPHTLTQNEEKLLAMQTEMAQAVLGRGATEVAHIGGSHSTALAVSYGDGPLLLLQLGLPAQEWTLCVHTESKSMLSARVDPSRLYAPFLRAFLEGCRGERAQQPETIQGALEAVKVHLAAHQSRRTGRTVPLDQIAEDAAFDGGAFAAEYAAGKRKGAAS